jgi:citrate lyase subunit alpha/citrate CoA-transferase
MGFAIHDAKYADHTVIITDTLVDFPNMPSSIAAIDVDCVCVVDNIGDASKIATKEARMTDNPRELMMAEQVAKVISATPWFKDGFSFQTGVGGPSLAVNRFLEKYMVDNRITMSFALGEPAVRFVSCKVKVWLNIFLIHRILIQVRLNI